MTSIDVRDAGGKKTSTRQLPAEIFEAKVSVPLMHQVIVAGLAGIRAGTHSTKTRGEVAGGGRKPWRQKGTGRARHGSIRSPQWTGGGVAHGPSPRDHSIRINKKMRRGALRSALTDALQGGKLALVEDLDWKEPKTKQAAAVLDALDLGGRVLVVLPAPSGGGAVEKSFRNIPNLKVSYAKGLGTYDVLLADRVLLTVGALEGLTRSVEPRDGQSAAGPAAEEVAE
jgi:large subunit ribosomal protein L4